MEIWKDSMDIKFEVIRLVSMPPLQFWSNGEEKENYRFEEMIKYSSLVIGHVGT